MPTRNAIAQSVRIDLAFERPFSLDLIVRTPRQIERGLREDDCDWFLREVIEKGKVLYEGHTAQWILKAEEDAEAARRLAAQAKPPR